MRRGGFMNEKGTKKLIIETTKELIKEEGIHAVSMRELGRKLALSRGAVYVYFKNKEELLATIATDYFHYLQKTIQKNILTIDPPQKAIATMLTTFYDFGMQHPEEYRLMFLRSWPKENYSELHLAAQELFEVFFAYFVKLKSTSSSPQLLFSMASSMVLGLVELNVNGHVEAMKGLDTPHETIRAFVQFMTESVNG